MVWSRALGQPGSKLPSSDGQARERCWHHNLAGGEILDPYALAQCSPRSVLFGLSADFKLVEECSIGFATVRQSRITEALGDLVVPTGSHPFAPAGVRVGVTIPICLPMKAIETRFAFQSALSGPTSPPVVP